MGNKSSVKYIAIPRSSQSLSCSGFGPISDATIRLKLTKQRIGSDRPTYKSVIRSGLNATNYMEAYKQSIAYTPGFVEAGYFYPGCAGNGKTVISTEAGITAELAPVPSYSSPTLQIANTKALVDIRNRIRQETETFSGLTFLGEIRDVVHQIRHPAKAMREYTDNFLQSSLRKRGRMSKKKFGNALAESWLEYSFGVIPLMSDISSIAEAALPRFQEPRIKRIFGKGAAESSLSTSFQQGVLSLNILASSTKHDTEVCTTRYLCGYRQKVENPSSPLQSIIDRSGFNLSNIIPTAWELLPWSFFIDYFSNIGDVLSASLVSTENVVWTCRTDRIILKKIVTVGGYKADSGSQHILIRSKYPKCISTTSGVRRQSSELAIPQLRFELPGRNTQFLNIAALARLQFR